MPCAKLAAQPTCVAPCWHAASIDAHFKRPSACKKGRTNKAQATLRIPPLSPFIRRLRKWRLASLRLISRHAEMNQCPLPTTTLFSSPISTCFLFHGEQMPRSTHRINSDSRRGFEDSETAPVTVTRNVRYRTLSRLSAAEHSCPFSGGPLEMTGLGGS